MVTLAVDPNYFAVNWETTGEVLAMIVVLSFFTERALALLFENKWFINFEKSRDLHLKEIIALVVASIVCFITKLDALTIVLLQSETTFFGYVFTGAIIGGGSKASVKLFRDMMKVKSAAQEGLDAKKKVEIEKVKKDAKKELDMEDDDATDGDGAPRTTKKIAKKKQGTRRGGNT